MHFSLELELQDMPVIAKMWERLFSRRSVTRWDHNKMSLCFRCPAYTKLAEKDFHFPDPDQCDKYWTCQNGNSRRSLCPDGLVFHPDKEDGEDPCDLRHNVPDKCEGREDLQRPKPGGFDRFYPGSLNARIPIISTMGAHT